MITHDVDEAMLLADKILLMTNGPKARIAEIVEVTLPRPRSRSTVIFEPNYYPIRNHLVDFLVSRSKTFRDQPPTGYDPRHPPQVRPQADGSAAPPHPATSGAPHDP